MPDTDNLILSLLGPLEFTLGGAPMALRYHKLRALLAYLAVEAGRPHRGYEWKSAGRPERS